MKKLALLGILLITAMVIGCTQPKEVCATGPDCKCVKYTIEPGAVYSPARDCTLVNGIKKCTVITDEKGTTSCKEVLATEEDLKSYCRNQITSLYKCKDGYFKILKSESQSPFEMLKPGHPAETCNLVAGYALSENCQAGGSDYCSEENLCEGSGLANPASVHCEEQGGTLQMYNKPEGTIGYCKFSDGSACEEWDYYNGKCVQGDCEIKCDAIGTRSEGWYFRCENIISKHEGRLVYANCADKSPIEPTPFCGSSTNAACETNSDCVAGGCSGQVCEGKDEGTITTCEYLPCYSAASYNLTCQCIDKQCKWKEKQETPGTLNGTVTLIQGNCMPGPELDPSCTTNPISTTIYIREPATTEDLENNTSDYFITLIKQVESDENGYYEVELPSGTYSVFVDDNNEEYCNSFGGQGEACQITVEEETTTEYNIKIDHAAW
ncbi:DUF333 domain-containing protein [archaeon]|nr:DUF333 domain-containing protein [archaeon]